jgi:opacity protein-like surface antigen
MRTTRFLAMLTFAAAPLLCSAQQPGDRHPAPLAGTYVSFNVGISKYKFSDPPAAGAGTDLCFAGSFDCKDDPTGYKGQLGYMIWPYFGFEVVGYNMGDAKVKVDLGGGNVLQQMVRLEGYAFNLVGAAPLGPVTLNGRLGLAAASVTRKDELNGANVGRSTKSRAEPLFGAGVAVQVYRGMFVSLDWDHARGRSTVGEKFEADMFSAGVGYRF